MRIIPITLRHANSFVREHHRHNDPVGGCKYAIGCMENGVLIGVAIAGRPVARHMDDGLTIEIVRLCTNGHPNAYSKLYGAALRIAREMGYRKAITYTRIDEPGVSLRASGWTMEAVVKGRTWNRSGRPRRDFPMCDKRRWAKYLK